MGEAVLDERLRLSGGAALWRLRPTSTESTFGTGAKTPRGTLRMTRTSQASWASTEGTP